MPFSYTDPAPGGVQRIAVVGSGISGLAAAWLLARRHRVTLFESEPRPGGHSHTVELAAVRGAALAVDMGFIVYNEPNYPNLAALFAHLGVETRATQMSFAVSLDGGALEYCGSDLKGLFAQRANIASLRFWSMLRDLARFYRHAGADALARSELSLEQYLEARGYGRAFREDHLYPMAAAIWSTPIGQIGRYPASAFVRFCDNHRLLDFTRRPAWRTVVGGSRRYVRRLLETFGGELRLACGVHALRRDPCGVSVVAGDGAAPERFDQVVLAVHADQALRLLDSPAAEERALLGAFGYTRNRALLHRDPGLMPRRRAVWSSWNCLAQRGSDAALCVSYWMNRLQHIEPANELFVTLNPMREPAAGSVEREVLFEHPLFDLAALRAQRALWRLQGRRRTWFCGAYFGAGFHEDGLQAGLAVAEAIGGVRRPWSVAGESDRIHLPAPAASAA